jgi:hypothetical protein
MKNKAEGLRPLHKLEWLGAWQRVSRQTAYPTDVSHVQNNPGIVKTTITNSELRTIEQHPGHFSGTAIPPYREAIKTRRETTRLRRISPHRNPPTS